MGMEANTKLRPLWLALTLVVVASNYILYRASRVSIILPFKIEQMVLVSIASLLILVPIFLMLYRSRFSFKAFILFFALGCVALRLIIPIPLLAPYIAIIWLGLAVEGVFIVFELVLIGAFIRYLPKIRKDIKENALPFLFAFSETIKKYSKNNTIIQMFCSEIMVFYYAFFSWKKPIPNGLTLYKKSSLIAFHVMLMHAIVIETIGIHYWLHSKAPLLSIILLILNIYSVVFFLADLQAVRFNPIHISDDALYISLGLMKRAKIKYDDIELIVEEKAILHKKLSKQTVDFMARDFDVVQPDFILKMKQPQAVMLAFGIEKKYEAIAIKCDEPAVLKKILKEKISIKDSSSNTY